MSGDSRFRGLLPIVSTAMKTLYILERRESNQPAVSRASLAKWLESTSTETSWEQDTTIASVAERQNLSPRAFGRFELAITLIAGVETRP